MQNTIQKQNKYISSVSSNTNPKSERNGEMEMTDTIKLLQECDAGSKMAVSAIDEVLDKTVTQELVELLSESKKHHEKLGNDLHAMLNQERSDEKEPNPMAKGMSKLKIGLKMGMDHTDATVAELITEGCDMGINSLYRYQNQYSMADESAKDICKRLIAIEEELRDQLRKFL